MQNKFGLAISLAFAMSSFPAVAIAEDMKDGNSQLVLFGAHWCAPCRAEAEHLPAIVAAAAPARIVVAWIDRPLALPTGLPAGRIASLSPAAAETLAERLVGTGFGLPVTVSIDGSGHVCAVHHKALRQEDVGTMLMACRPKT